MSIQNSEACNDHTFFNENIVPHYLSIIKFIIRTTNDSHLAYDIAQDTMANAWEYIKTMRHYDNIEAALITMAKNNLKKHYSKNPVSLPVEEITDSMSTDRAIEDIVIAAETDEELKKMFLLLDEKYSRVLILRHFYEMSIKEIANMYGVKYNTVLSWYARATKKLKKLCNENNLF